MVIGTNIAAMQSARYMDDAMNRLSTSLSRLSSGSKITSPEDDAAGLAQALKLGAESNRNKAVVSNLTNALSYSQTQDGLLEKVQKAMDRMGELAMLANDVTKTDTDRSNYHQEFSQLQSYISDIKDKKFNGISLFGSSSQSVTNAAKGERSL